MRSILVFLTVWKEIIYDVKSFAIRLVLYGFCVYKMLKYRMNLFKVWHVTIEGKERIKPSQPDIIIFGVISRQ